MPSDSVKKRGLFPGFCEYPGCNGVPGYPALIQHHRILPGREGGKYRRSNVISLCPNCHLLADKGYIEREFLLEIVIARIELEQTETEHDEHSAGD